MRASDTNREPVGRRRRVITKVIVIVLYVCEWADGDDDDCDSGVQWYYKDLCDREEWEKKINKKCIIF